MRHLTCVFAFLVWAFVSFAAQAETRALLIGVSDYDESIGLLDLKGPKNDVSLLAATLKGRGIDQIEILADGIDGAQTPTRAAILAGFANLAATAQDGDFVFIHLSGHGTRQADRSGDEADGLDEVFLPSDTARAEPGTNQIPNAITDDEIGAALAAIRATGADVWFVLDSCHSGSGTRAGSLNTATRFVDPSVLGVAAEPVYLDEKTVVEHTQDDLPGGLMAFYSAQSTELAREVNFAAETGGDEWYGLFTAKLAARLQTSEGLTFRQLFQAVLSDLNATGVPGAARLQTPLWEGNLIDAAVFGGEDTVGIRRFAISDGFLSAGLVHGIAEGTLLGLVSDAADAPDALIGYAQAFDLSTTEADLRAVSADCAPSTESACAATGPIPEGAQFAQVIAHPSDAFIRFAPPRDFVTGETLPETHALTGALTDAIVETNDSGRAAVALSQTGYAIDVVAANGALWFGPQSDLQPTGLMWHPDSGQILAGLLHRMAKAETLARVLTNVSDSASVLNPSPISVDTSYFNTPVDQLVPIGSDVSPVRECRRILGRKPEISPGSLPENARLKQCDAVGFQAKGDVRGSHDVNRIHIDAQYCVHAAYERIEGIANALRLGPEMVLCSDCPTGYSAGAERLFVMVTESQANAEPLNLAGLIENCETEAPTRGAALRDAQAFFDTLGKRPDTRGAFGNFAVADIWVDSWTWRVLPRRDAFLRAGRDPNADVTQE
ncbi:MAG: caspase family protein [Pseudomonadota bacterium]